MRREINLRTCLNCKYQPDWSAWSKGKYSYQWGRCKWADQHSTGVALPASLTIRNEPIMRFKDNSGIHTRCAAWRKEE